MFVVKVYCKIDLTVNFDHEPFIDLTNRPWVSEDEGKRKPVRVWLQLELARVRVIGVECKIQLTMLRTLKHRNTQNGSKSSNHKSETTTFEPVKVKFCFLRSPLRWLTAAKNAIVSWVLNFRIRMSVKSAVRQWLAHFEAFTFNYLFVKIL